MNLVKELFFKCFKSSSPTYYFHFPKYRLFSRNHPVNSNVTNESLDNTTLIKASTSFKTAELTPERLLKFISSSENDEKLLKIINEINFILARKRRCPEYLNSTELCELYALETKTQRLKYLIYLFKQEKVKEKDRLEKEDKKKQNKKLKKDSILNSDLSNYGYGRKTLFLFVRRQSIVKFYNRRLANSVLFGSKIVIDLDYDKYMVEKEKRSCAAQLRHLIVANRQDRYPFDLYFCNAISTYKCVQYLKHDIPNVENSLNSLYEGSYLDIFPREQLVYLSPHADESLKTFDPHAIYIIGGFVDTVKKVKISTEKASTEGIKTYSLPLDDYVKWKGGSKSLTINQVFEIMLVFKNTGDWKKAFECIPIRKIQNIKDLDEEEELKSQAVLTN